MSVSLQWLLDGIVTLPANNARVEDLTLDSREVRTGSLFFALRGVATTDAPSKHGLSFAADAVARGASVVLWEPPDDATAPVAGAAIPASVAALGTTVFVAQVVGLRQLLGRIADRFFGWPSSHMCIVGITGTNGKTTSAYLLAQCLERLKSSAAYIGTLGWGRMDLLQAPILTTPDVVTVHRQLSILRTAGVRNVAIEVSSHALDQGRVDGVRFACAAFTNLTRDHLDYHASMHDYGLAKARLFAVEGLRQVVVNIGDAFGRELALTYSGRAALTAVWVGPSDRAWLADRTLNAREVMLHLRGLSIAVGGSYGEALANTKLLGRFNAENAVIVLGCLVALGVPLTDAVTALAQCAAPPGRMELIEPSSRGGPLVVVDYAHTPDALSNALHALREHCRGVLWCVFGCGGDRDSGKRPLMGGIVDELADQIIVTDDNPRSENPRSITSSIASAITRHAVRIIHDRSVAIATAVTEAAPDDLVLIAGKGHEDYQIYGSTRRTFSDRQEAVRHLGAAA